MSAYAKNYGYFFNSSSGDRTYNAESFEEWLKPFFISGVFNGELQVKAQTTPDMTVKVTAGHANLDGKAATWETDNTMQLAVSSGVYDRIDTIVLRRDNVNRTISIEVVTGTASGSPQPTAPTRNADTFELVLAEVYVGTGVTAITQANITDKRMDSTVCGYVAATVDQIDFDQIYEQYEQWQADTQDYFTAWFESIRGQLDEDAAGHLQNEIDDLTADLDDLSTDLVADTQYYTINGNTSSEGINANRFVRLINSTVSGRADGIYFVNHYISAGTPVTSDDLKYPSDMGGLLNKLAGSWLNKGDIVDDLTSIRTDVALSANQGKVLNSNLTTANTKIGHIDTRASLILGGDATSTTQSFSTYNGRKFSDYRMLVFYLYNSNSDKSQIRNCIMLPRSAWTSGKNLFLLQNHGVNMANISGIMFTYDSDTSIKAVLQGNGSLTGFSIEAYMNI